MRVHVLPGPCSTSMQASLRFGQARRQTGLTRSLKEGGSGPLRPNNDDGAAHRARQVATQLRGLQEGNASDDENGASQRVSDQDPLKSDLSWNDLDKEQKNNWLRKAFVKVDNTRTVFSTIPTSENQPERLVQLFEEPATRQRFVRRCLIPTGTACILGCVAYALRLEFGFSGLSVLGHNLVAGLLGFLMAFITSTNYNRWLQARSGLCNITIMCVDIASRADVFITTKDEDGIRARREMARYLRLLYTSIILTLTDTSLWGGNAQDTKAGSETSKQLRRIMMEDASPSERRLLLGGGPRDLPFLVIELIRQHINKDTTLKSFVHNTFGSQFIAITCQDNLKGKVDELFPAIGTVLSLALTPLPMGFRTIYSTILNVLVYTFPFALVSEITWETPIVSSFLAFGYYGVYSMSQELMLPFRPRTQATGSDGKSYKPGLFSCNADWVRVMNDEFNRILIKKPV